MGLWSVVAQAVGAGLSSLLASSPGTRASTQFALAHAADVAELERLVAVRGGEIEADNACLAELRLAASRELCVETLRAAADVRTAARFRRDLARAKLRRSHSTTIWTRFAVSGDGDAERELHVADALDEAAAGLLAFVGLHRLAAAGVRAARARAAPDAAARAIVSASRQALSFLRAVQRSHGAAALASHVGDAVSHAAADSVLESPPAPGTAGTDELGRFWRANGGADAVARDGADGPGITPHDVRLTLQVLRKELADVRGLGASIAAAVHADTGASWQMHRSSMLYTELAVAGGAAARVLWTRSRLAGGSGELEDAVARGVKTVQGFAQKNVIIPFAGLYSQIFRDTVSTASMKSVAETQFALTKMLVDFAEDHLQGIASAKQAAEAGDMSNVLQLYTEQARHPFNSLVFGQLAQTMLLQVQKLKCDVEELVVKSKQQLQAQELNLALVALVPAVGIVGAAAFMGAQAVRAWRARGTELVVSPEQTVRFLLGNVYDSLVELKEEEEEEGGRGGVRRDTERVMKHLERLGQLGLAFFETRRLVEKGVLRGPPEVLDRFLDDLAALERSEASMEGRIRHLQKLWSCYPFFMPLVSTTRGPI